MIVDPHPKLDSDESAFISNCYVQSTKNQLNGDISKIVLTHLIKRWDQSKTQLHPSSTDITSAERISLKVCIIVMKYCHIQTNYPVNCCMSLFTSSIFQSDKSNNNTIINKDRLYVMGIHVK